MSDPKAPSLYTHLFFPVLFPNAKTIAMGATKTEVYAALAMHAMISSAPGISNLTPEIIAETATKIGKAMADQLQDAES